MIAGYPENKETTQPQADGTGETLSLTNPLRPEARQALDRYLLTLCQHLHRGLLELRDNLVEQAESQVLRQVRGDSVDQVQQALASLGAPELHASWLIRQLHGSP